MIMRKNFLPMRKEKIIGSDYGKAEGDKVKSALELTSLKTDEKEKASRTLLENEQSVDFEMMPNMRYLAVQSFL